MYLFFMASIDSMFHLGVEIMIETEMAGIDIGLDRVQRVNLITDQGLVPVRVHNRKGKTLYIFLKILSRLTSTCDVEPSTCLSKFLVFSSSSFFFLLQFVSFPCALYTLMF